MGAPQGHICTLRWHRAVLHSSGCRSRSNHSLPCSPHSISSVLWLCCCLQERLAAVLSVSRQETADSGTPCQASAAGHPAAQSSPLLSPRLSPAERLTCRQAGKAPGQLAPDKGGEAPGQPTPVVPPPPPQLRLLCHGKVSGLRQPSAHREALGAVTRPSLYHLFSFAHLPAVGYVGEEWKKYRGVRGREEL